MEQTQINNLLLHLLIDSFLVSNLFNPHFISAVIRIDIHNPETERITFATFEKHFRSYFFFEIIRNLRLSTFFLLYASAVNTIDKPMGKPLPFLGASRLRMGSISEGETGSA